MSDAGRLSPYALAGAAVIVAAALAYAWRALVATQTGNDSQAEGDDGEPTMLDTLGAEAQALVNRIAGYSAASLTVSPAGVDAIKAREGLRLQRYRLGDGGWTIGYGRYFPDSGGPPPESITREQAEAWLVEDIEAKAARWVRAYVTAPLTQSQFDALASMAFNLSPKSFRTIAEAVNRGEDPEDAAMVFVRAGTNLERGLRNRRAEELALYRSEGIAA